ncbi:MAG: guanylate kinase [Betaproteobacteria bacterium]
MMSGLESLPKASLFVVVAPSGAGKTTLVRSLLRSRPTLCLSISTTTRLARPAEREGVDYYFVSRSRFEHMRDEGCFLEWAEVHGNYYGTSRAVVMAALTGGNDLLLEIDCQGAAQVRSLFQDAITIFVAPPSVDALRERLQGRAQDDPETIERRIRGAQGELARAHEADYLIINDDFDRALRELTLIVDTAALRYRLRYAQSPALAHALRLQPGSTPIPYTSAQRRRD